MAWKTRISSLRMRTSRFRVSSEQDTYWCQVKETLVLLLKLLLLSTLNAVFILSYCCCLARKHLYHHINQLGVEKDKIPTTRGEKHMY